MDLIEFNSRQGGNSWQPFGEGKNDHKKIRQARDFYFRDKCLVFARNVLADFAR